MDHVVYLDHKACELENLRSGVKDMLIRGAMGRKLPHGRVNEGDILYFIRNNGEGKVTARAVIQEVIHSEKLSVDESQLLVSKYASRLCLDANMTKRFSGKRYLVLITIKAFKELAHFQIDRSEYGNMDDWLPVVNIDRVKLSK